ARRSTTAGAVVGGTVQTRKTAPAPRSAASSEPGTVRSPVTTSTFAGSAAAASERRVRARTGTPAPISWPMTARPTRPVAAVTSTGGTRVRVMRTPASSVIGARSESCHLPGGLIARTCWQDHWQAGSPLAAGRGDEQLADRPGQVQRAGQQQRGVFAGGAVDPAFQVTDRPRGQAGRLGGLLLPKPSIIPPPPQSNGERKDRLLRHRHP